MHLLRRRHAHDAEAVPDNLSDRIRQGKPRPADFRLIRNQEAACRIVIAPVPQGVEGSREIEEVEGDSMRLMRRRRLLDHARELRGELHQRQLLRIEQRKIGLS